MDPRKPREETPQTMAVDPRRPRPVSEEAAAEYKQLIMDRYLDYTVDTTV